jgi:hypothetical protein
VSQFRGGFIKKQIAPLVHEWYELKQNNAHHLADQVKTLLDSSAYIYPEDEEKVVVCALSRQCTDPL